MKQVFSRKWKASTQARKQRKYVANVPNHIKSNMMGVHLSKELREKYSKRTIRIRVGDKVKILRGQFKGKMGKVERVDVNNQKVFVEKIESQKKDGTKTPYPLKASNLVVIELDTNDKIRKQKLTGKKVVETTPTKKAEAPKKAAEPKKEEAPKKEEKAPTPAKVSKSSNKKEIKNE
jgi:large subunit ribosomal protein L24